MKTQKEFEGHITALEIVAIYLDRSKSLLNRSVEGKILLSNKDASVLQLSLTHYIVNNISALFDENKKVNSLLRIAKRFKKSFPNDFFVEHVISVTEFRTKHFADLKRIQKNRHLSSAHLGASKEDRLGWSSRTAKHIDEALGGQSSIAQKDSLLFITPHQLLDMVIVQEIPEIYNIIRALSLKVLIERNSKRMKLSEE